MTVFWIVAAMLIFAAVLFVSLPLMRPPRAGDRIARATLNLGIRRDQLRELEADLKGGVISREQFDEGRLELERALLAETGEGDSAESLGKAGAASTAPLSARKVALVVALLVPVLSVSLYFKLGRPDLLSGTPQPVAEQGGHDITVAQLTSMVQSLADRLEQQPDDPEGWVMLGRSYAVLRQFDKSAVAYGRAYNLIGDSPDLLADYADALAMANDGRFDERSLALIDRALKADPGHPKSLWLAGTVAYEKKDYPRALELWERLAMVVPPDSDGAKAVAANIAEVRSLMGEAAPPPDQAAPVAAGAAHVSGTVELDAALKDRLDPAATLFIYAKAVQGPPMPLAILRLSASDLPASFNLDEKMAMMPQMSLARFGQVMVGARVSASGNAMAQSGDLQGTIGPVDVGSEGLKVVIDEVVP